ncbi:hypothetical protein M501DRAFT_69960 [Patellaria atrata CBS 101060]|uniref:Uncharacterized protein n=1 Tax=Patellaria atrata CBS 101060 TaxID=1346257 RepID=A0A9P4SHV6_9PEZI|nr:hypothetical protein M501DRAFT_69960 [Patellaria atrata CBS 101060]
MLYALCLVFDGDYTRSAHIYAAGLKPEHCSKPSIHSLIVRNLLPATLGFSVSFLTWLSSTLLFTVLLLYHD